MKCDLMGEKDLHRIYPIYRYLVEKYHNFKWELDSGKYETAVTIDGTRPKEFSDKYFVPDIYSYSERIAVEFQEQPTRKKHIGRLSKKGHTEFSDEEKDAFYNKANIRQIKIWDDDKDWKVTIDKAITEFGY